MSDDRMRSSADEAGRDVLLRQIADLSRRVKHQRREIAILRGHASKPQPKGMPAEWLDAFEEWRQTLGAADLDGKRDLVWRHIAGTGFQAGAAWARSQAPAPAQPIDMVLHCPACGKQHIDGPDNRKRRWLPGDRALTPYGVGTISRLSSGTGFTEAYFADLTLPAGHFAVNERDLKWPNEPHRSHLCHGCGHIWRPADVPTNGVQAVQTKGKADSPIRAPAVGAEPVRYPHPDEDDPVTLWKEIRRLRAAMSQAKCDCTAYCGQYVLHGSCRAHPAPVTISHVPVQGSES